MKTSAAGIEIIKQNEGCRLTAYIDTIADPPRWTIGWGDTQNVHKDMMITQEEADERLYRRLTNEFEPAVLTACGGKASQNQFDAMVSLAWNIGTGAFAKSSVARFHRARDYEAAAEAFKLWNHASGRVIPGLTRRRREERALYLSAAPYNPGPVIPPAPPPPAPFEIDVDLVADLVRALQRVVDVNPDGILGRITIAAIEDAQKAGNNHAR